MKNLVRIQFAKKFEMRNAIRARYIPSMMLNCLLCLSSTGRRHYCDAVGVSKRTYWSGILRFSDVMHRHYDQYAPSLHLSDMRNKTGILSGVHSDGLAANVHSCL